MSYALLINIDKCDGCGGGDEYECQKACQKLHGLPLVKIEKLTATNYTFSENVAEGIYVRRMCQHCEEPTCVSVCPVGAMEKTGAGPVIYHSDRCLGCRYCVMACPFNVPKYEWSSTSPRVRKCTMCYEERTSKGQPTACADACQAEATVFGERDDLIASALKRLNEDKGYVQKIYGMKEAGGTGVLYISKVPFEKLGFVTTLGYEPLPRKTWNVLSKLPDVVSIGGVMLAGIWWMTKRRDEVKAYEDAQKKK